MHTERKPKVPFQLTIDEDLLNKAREEALKEGRSLSNWIDRLIESELSKAPELAK